MLNARSLYPFLLASLGLLGACNNPGADPDESHLGGALLLEPVRPGPAQPHYRSPLRVSQEYGTFSKHLGVNGIDLIAGGDVSDAFLNDVADVIESMFVPEQNMDLERQKHILVQMHRHRTTIPCFRGEPEFSQALERTMEQLSRNNSICDIIMQDVEGQAMEVVEHILHHVTDVGLHLTYPEEWGLSRDSELYALMQQAIAAGYYDIRQYQEILDHDPEVHLRVLLQEFAYWILTCEWNLQLPYGPEDSEWSGIRTSQQLQAKLPEASAMIQRTVGNTISPPSPESLAPFRD